MVEESLVNTQRAHRPIGVFCVIIHATSNENWGGDQTRNGMPRKAVADEKRGNRTCEVYLMSDRIDDYKLQIYWRYFELHRAVAIRYEGCQTWSVVWYWVSFKVTLCVQGSTRIYSHGHYLIESRDWNDHLRSSFGAARSKCNGRSWRCTFQPETISSESVLHPYDFMSLVAWMSYISVSWYIPFPAVLYVPVITVPWISVASLCQDFFAAHQCMIPGWL
jgi:hypothetical protein